MLRCVESYFDELKADSPFGKCSPRVNYQIVVNLIMRIPYACIDALRPVRRLGDARRFIAFLPEVDPEGEERQEGRRRRRRRRRTGRAGFNTARPSSPRGS